jgi:hypothetical protein
MTKWGSFAFGPRGHHIANFPLRVADDDAINEQCDQLSALGQGERVQSQLRAPAKRLDALGQGGHIDRLRGLGIQLSQLLSQALLGLRRLLALPLELVTREHLGQG